MRASFHEDLDDVTGSEYRENSKTIPFLYSADMLYLNNILYIIYYILYSNGLSSP